MENILIRKRINFNLISKIIIYFVIYSFIGFCFESVFGIFSKGVLESRKSFLFGPFCAIYGIGAILMIFSLNKYKDKTILLFLGSAFIGAIAEYMMSYFCEIFFHFKWWDYSDLLLNIQGRTCLFFILIWGILGTLLIKYVNPKINLFIKKLKSIVSYKTFKLFIFGISLYLIADIALTTYSLKYLYSKISYDYSLEQSNYSVQKTGILQDSFLLSEDYLIKNFPNIRLAGYKMDNIFVDSLYKVSPTYYFKFFKQK